MEIKWIEVNQTSYDLWRFISYNSDKRINFFDIIKHRNAGVYLIYSIDIGYAHEELIGGHTEALPYQRVNKVYLGCFNSLEKAKKSIEPFVSEDD